MSNFTGNVTRGVVKARNQIVGGKSWLLGFLSGALDRTLEKKKSLCTSRAAEGERQQYVFRSNECARGYNFRGNICMNISCNFMETVLPESFYV